MQSGVENMHEICRAYSRASEFCVHSMVSAGDRRGTTKCFLCIKYVRGGT